MFNSVILALSVSIDSLGIGITYGIKNAKIGIVSKCILFAMSIFFTACSFFIGDFINSVMSEFFTKIISSGILALIGVIVLIDPIPFDLDHSLKIDTKEAFILGIALSLDSICVGIGSSIGGYSNFYFPILVSLFQLFFLSFGNLIGKKIITNLNIPDKMWNYFSGILLIFFGIVKLFI